MYEKFVTKGAPDCSYLHIRLDFEEGTRASVDVVQFKQVLLEAVNVLFGQTLACSLIDVLKYDPIDRSAVLRIEHRNLEKVWASLTLYSRCGQTPCAFRILQVSPHLISLAGNSRGVALVTTDD